jgi:hypothetical protein
MMTPAPTPGPTWPLGCASRGCTLCSTTDPEERKRSCQRWLQVEAQLDDLLSALEGLVSVVSREGYLVTAMDRNRLEAARAAIARLGKVLAPGHGFNSERSQRAENGGRP